MATKTVINGKDILIPGVGTITCSKNTNEGLFVKCLEYWLASNVPSKYDIYWVHTGKGYLQENDLVYDYGLRDEGSFFVGPFPEFEFKETIVEDQGIGALVRINKKLLLALKDYWEASDDDRLES